MIENIKQILLTVRDIIISFMPNFINKILIGSGDYVFLAHPIELLPDISRKYPFATHLPKGLLKFISKYHPPIILSKVTGFKNMFGREINGWIVFCSLSTRMMLLNKKIAIEKIVKAAKFCEKLNAKLLGLGAFVPIVTEHGSYLQGKVNMKITNGDAFSAIIASKNVLKSVEFANLNKEKTKIAIIGAAGFVGSMSCKLLTKHFSNFLLIDKNINKLKILYEKLKNDNPQHVFSIANSVLNTINADVILTVTNAPGVIIRSHHVKPKTIIIDAAQPRNVSNKIPFERNDVIVIESGIAEVEGINTNCNFGLKKQNEVYSCFAELLMLCWLDNYQQEYLVDIPDEYISQLWENMDSAGIKIAEFRNIKGYVNINMFREIFGQ